MSTTFGQYTKEQRLSLGISSRKLSEKVGKSSSYISSIENGLYKPDYKMAYKILKELRIEMPNDSILEFLHSLEIEVPSVSRVPNSSFFEQDELEYKIDRTNIKVTKKSHEPDYQKLYEERQEELIEKLKGIFEQIEDDISNYPASYDDCKDDSTFESVDKFLTTFTDIMLSNEMEIFDKFYELMGLPLFKLNPVQFRELIDHANNLLEYEYVFESGENSKTQEYPHYRVKYKEKPTIQ